MTSTKLRTASLAVLFVGLIIPAAAQDTHVKLYPLLIDLAGWEAAEPEGASMDMGEFSLITAQRDYTEGDAELRAMFMIGNNAMLNNDADMTYNSDSESLKTEEIDGFRVLQGYDKEEHSGVVTVFLSHTETKGALFMLTYRSIPAARALELAKKFNWKKIKETTAPLL
ncbi:hypothetical protein JXO52_17080 [bacterium]|nr:hypothetical protein [bacterium]